LSAGVRRPARPIAQGRAARARAAGAKGLIVTLDWVFDSRRDWGSPWIPETFDFKAMMRYAPQVAVRLRRGSEDMTLTPSAQERILAAAEKLFAERGFDRTSTARIATEAGVPHGLIFYHFKTLPHPGRILTNP
jgi:Bacterial regulatory proteins, tetR family